MKKNWNLIIKKQLLYLAATILIMTALYSLAMAGCIYSRGVFHANETWYFFITGYSQAVTFLLAWLFLIVAIATSILSINAFLKISFHG